MKRRGRRGRPHANGSGADGSAGDEAVQDKVEALSPLVEQEARRLLADEQLAPDPVLVRAGWERRFIADGRRAEEAMELYEKLGYEVRAEPVRVEEVGEECDDCQLLIALQFKTIYTRKKSHGERE